MKLLLILLNVVMLTFPLLASEPAPESPDEPLYAELQRLFKTKPLSIGALLQVVGDFQTDRTAPGFNGFNIANFRLNLRGELDGGFSYFLQTSFTQSPAILDAKMGWQVTPGLTLDGGLFKTPFSKEFLTGAASIDFVNRAQVVSALRAGRQIGVQLRGADNSKTFTYAAGVFNGNGARANGNDDNGFMYVGRLAVFPSLEGNTHLEVGANAAYSKDRSVQVLGSGFSGKRTLLGGDFRFTSGKLLLASEVIWTELTPTGGTAANPFGYHATAGYYVADNVQLLARWDSFRPDAILGDSDLLIAGFNLWPTGATELQANIIFPTRNTNVNKPQLLINGQVSF